MKSQNNHGFTIIELALVIALISTLSTIGIFSYRTFLPSLRLSGSAREISATLQLARVKAISNNKNYKVIFNSGGAYQTYKEISTGNWQAEDSSQTLPVGISFNRGGSDPITFTNDEALFNPTGGLSSASGGVYLKNSRSQAYSVTVVNTTGRVKVQRE